MHGQRHQQAKALFLEACERPTAQRPAFLDARCAGDAELRRQVEELLAADADTGFLATPPSAPASLDHIAGERGYRLVRRLGAGGMGEVWLAERADGEFRQRVAIKRMQYAASLSQDALQRFRAERQILASLSHPNIARLLDGGTLADGAPFLVMEYVDGQALDAWCESSGLDLRARVRLFLKVCDAVQAAHAALIVHRDLKPSNILVGADGEPKLLDFGIAKILDASQFGETLLRTETGRAPMTIAYASPEQVRGGAIGTASDVYSLGVVLYELLTGALPYRAPAGDALGLARAVCEQPPEPPSRQTAAAGRSRGTQQAAARTLLRGDPDAILMLALRKEPAERYRSVGHFAADLQRWLDGLPVLARRGSRVYAARKFVARHRWAVAAALLFLALLLGFALDRQQQLQVAQRQRDRAEQSLGLLREVLASADPKVARGEGLSAKQILAGAAGKLVGDTTVAIDLRFDLLLAIAEIEQALGLTEQTRAHADILRALAEDLPPPAAERVQLLRLLDANSRNDTAADALGAPLAAAVLAGTSPLDTADRARALVARASTLNLLSRGAEAAPLLERALELLREVRDPRLEVSANAQLGQVLQNLGRLAQAEVYLRRALDASLRHGFDPYRVSRDQNNLAGVLAMQGRFHEALALHEDAILRFEQGVGRAHPEYAIRLNNLGATEIGAGRVEQAIDHLRQALELARERYGADSVVHALSLVNLATAETVLGRFDDAQTHSDGALAILLPKFGAANLQSIRARRTAGLLALERADAATARTHFEACIEGAREAGLLATPGVTRCQVGLAELALEDGDIEAGARLLDAAEAAQAGLDARHFERGAAALVRAAWYLRQDLPAPARARLAAIAPEALNEPWQPAWRELLDAAASGRCDQVAAARSVLAARHPQGHPRWRSLCPPP